LTTLLTGASARPFITHHNAQDIDMYMRIALELSLKRLLVGGMEAVYEIGRTFRNEGMDPMHNPEFTMMEAYLAYSNLDGMMDLTEGLYQAIAQTMGKDTFRFLGHDVTIKAPFKRVSIVEAIKEGFSGINGASIVSLIGLFAPVGFVVLAEHIGDHKNLSTIIDRDLITDPGLDKTVMGDGVGTIVGSVLGGCPNTTYGECVGCVAITGNASIYTICTTAIMAMVLSFFNPFVQFVNTIPVCVIGGICIALYGFIAVSGLKMIQKVDLNDNRYLLVVASILVPGIGGLTLNLGPITLTNIATALIIGIVVNAILSIGEKKAGKAE
jgi:uracil permease